MAVSEFLESSKEYLDNRLKNPYFASVAIVWICINKTLVFGILNFDENMSMTDRIDWARTQLYSFKLWEFEGAGGGILFAFLFGFLTMVFFNVINGLGKAAYKLINNLSNSIIRRVPNSGYVTGTELDILHKKYIDATSELHTKRDKVIELGEEIVALLKSKSEAEEKLSIAQQSLSASSDEMRHEHSEFLHLQEEISKLQNMLFLQQVDLKSLSHVFPGVWKNSFTLQNKNSAFELFTIKGDLYHVNNKPVFRIENFLTEGNMVFFDKVHLETGVRLENRVTMKNQDLYSGTENLLTQVEYSREK